MISPTQQNLDRICKLLGWLSIAMIILVIWSPLLFGLPPNLLHLTASQKSTLYILWSGLLVIVPIYSIFSFLTLKKQYYALPLIFLYSFNDMNWFIESVKGIAQIEYQRFISKPIFSFFLPVRFDINIILTDITFFTMLMVSFIGSMLYIKGLILQNRK